MRIIIVGIVDAVPFFRKLYIISAATDKYKKQHTLTEAISAGVCCFCVLTLDPWSAKQ